MKYFVDCSWTCFGTMEIEAQSEAEARKEAMDTPICDFTVDYSIDNFQVENVTLMAEGEN